MYRGTGGSYRLGVTIQGSHYSEYVTCVSTKRHQYYSYKVQALSIAPRYTTGDCVTFTRITSTLRRCQYNGFPEARPPTPSPGTVYEQSVDCGWLGWHFSRPYNKGWYVRLGRAAPSAWRTSASRRLRATVMI